MRARHPWLLTTLLALTLAIVLTSCVDYHKKAQDELRRRGLTAVKMIESAQSGNSYTFTGARGDRPCKGRITVISMWGSSDVQFITDIHCAHPAAEASTANDPLAKDSAACDKGDLDTCARLAHKLVYTLEFRDLPRARKVDKKACEAGRHASCADLAGLMIRGLGGPRDFDGGQKLFAKACKAGAMNGCTGLGRIEYVEMHGKKARGLFAKACAGGDTSGCTGLGEVMREGVGGKRNLRRAGVLLAQACNDGDMTACTDRAMMFLAGQGGPKDVTRAKALLYQACKSGEQAACEKRHSLR